jgi:hypothetical protein
MKEFLSKWIIPQGFLFMVNSFRKKRIKPWSSEKIALLKKNEALANRHKGSRCFILGGGSSIARQDLKKLKGEYVISVSNTFVHPEFPLFQPQYHVLPHILLGHSKIYTEKEFVKWLSEMEKRTFNAEVFLHFGDRQMIEKNHLFQKRVIHWVEYENWDGDFDKKIDLSRVPNIWSVSELAITIAVYLGFKEIYLLGFDHDWFVGPLVYFYDAKTEHMLKPDKSKIPYVDAEYQMRRHADIFRKYKYLYSIKKNIYNANANPDHYLDVFPKVPLESLFG